MATEQRNGADEDVISYLIVRPEKGGFRDLFLFLVLADQAAAAKFLLHSSDKFPLVIPIKWEHRWVIVISIIIRKMIGIMGKPMEWSGCLVEFLLNLLSENGGILALLDNLLLAGKVVIPERNSETFISAIGHLDGRVDLYNNKSSNTNNGFRVLRGGLLLNEPEAKADAEEEEEDKEDPLLTTTGNHTSQLMDLSMMASKLAYENANVVRNIVVHHWKMHFVDFYNGWNDFQKDRSTQVFILCDKPRDANLILISFRGTEPFDANDWSTDFDYSWYEVPNLGKIHMGFLEALGLGNREQATTFQNHLQVGGYPLKAADEDQPSHSQDFTSKNKLTPEMVEMTAYYAVRSKLKSLLDEHKNAKFIVTGHSLGGALAILFPTILLLHEQKEMLQKLLCIYTFGQPRVGDRQLGNFMEAHVNHPVAKYFRVVYCNDLVPRLPYDDKTFLYKHFGCCLYYNSCYIEQKVKEEPNRNFFEIRYLILAYLNAVWELIRSFSMGYIHGAEYKEEWFSILLRVVGLALPGISAHSPVDYVNSVRLGRERVLMSPI